MEKKVIVSEKSPAAIGPYSQAIEYNGIVYTSGVIGVNPATGEVGETIEEQTTQVFENLKGLLADAGSSLDQAIKTTVFIKNMAKKRSFSKSKTRNLPVTSSGKFFYLKWGGGENINFKYEVYAYKFIVRLCPFIAFPAG